MCEKMVGKSLNRDIALLTEIHSLLVAMNNQIVVSDCDYSLSDRGIMNNEVLFDRLLEGLYYLSLNVSRLSDKTYDKVDEVISLSVLYDIVYKYSNLGKRYVQSYVQQLLSPRVTLFVGSLRNHYSAKYGRG